MVMTSSDTDMDPADDGIREGLRALPLPATPAEVAGRVHGQLRRRRIVKSALAILPVILLVAGLLLWRPWTSIEQTPPTLPEMAQGTAKPLDPDELLELFAAPPVDSLAILAKRDQVSVAALGRLEAKE
jgi:hypothetical protein